MMVALINAAVHIRRFMVVPLLAWMTSRGVTSQLVAVTSRAPPVAASGSSYDRIEHHNRLHNIIVLKQQVEIYFILDIRAEIHSFIYV